MQLTPTSYIVLGFLDQVGESTPYDLKQAMGRSVAYFWSVPHAQLYREPERLARGGYVRERREEGGRRRRFYALTDAGRAALEAWIAEQPEELPERREPGVLKLFFGADPREVAAGQLPLHEALLAEYERLRATLPDEPPGWRRALDAGIASERASIAFWRTYLSG